MRIQLATVKTFEDFEKEYHGNGQLIAPYDVYLLRQAWKHGFEQGRNEQYNRNETSKSWDNFKDVGY